MTAGTDASSAIGKAGVIVLDLFAAPRLPAPNCCRNWCRITGSTGDCRMLLLQELETAVSCMKGL